MKDLTNFKDRILFGAIHQEERYPSKEEDLEKAERVARWKHELTEGADSSYVLYIRLAMNVVYMDNLILLCQELKGRYSETNKHLPAISDHNDYIQWFKNRIERQKKAMVKLRPYVLKYTQNWNTERKQHDIDNPEFGKYFKNWYLTDPQQP